MPKYIEPSKTFSEAQSNWFDALKDWIENFHIITGVPGLTTALTTPITTLAAIFSSNRSAERSQSAAGQLIGAELVAYFESKMMADFAAANLGWTFVLAPTTPLDLTSSTKEGMFDIFSVWLTACGLSATNSGGTTFPCAFQQV